MRAMRVRSYAPALFLARSNRSASAAARFAVRSIGPRGIFHSLRRLLLLVSQRATRAGGGFQFQDGEIQRRHATDGAGGCCGASIQ